MLNLRQQVETFGLHTARLDLRQHSGRHELAVAELLKQMIENKALYLEEMFRKFIIPHYKKKIDTKEELSAFLSEEQVKRLYKINLFRRKLTSNTTRRFLCHKD